MKEHISLHRDSFFAGNRVAVVVNSFSRDCPRIASMVSRTIGSRADCLYVIASPQEEHNSNSDENDRTSWAAASLTKCLEAGRIYSKEKNTEIVESIDLDEIIDTETIDVVVLSTNSQDVVHDDPFVNDFLRRTDAPIHMSSDCKDDFCYYSRLQEGADIILW